jgi:hypothetical protein
MPKKPKARRGASKKTKAQKDKAQSERFIETARKLGVDETGKRFDLAFNEIIAPKHGAKRPASSSPRRSRES